MDRDLAQSLFRRQVADIHPATRSSRGLIGQVLARPCPVPLSTTSRRHSPCHALLARDDQTGSCPALPGPSVAGKPPTFTVPVMDRDLARSLCRRQAADIHPATRYSREMIRLGPCPVPPSTASRRHSLCHALLARVDRTGTLLGRSGDDASPKCTLPHALAVTRACRSRRVCRFRGIPCESPAPNGLG